MLRLLLSRTRSLITVVALVGVVCSLPGCVATGSRSDANAGGASRVIEHRYGSTEISSTPQRVVALGITDSDTLLALGVTPIALRPWTGVDTVGPWAANTLGDAEPTVLSSTEEVSVEDIAALEPDLIVDVSDAVSKKRYDLLSEVADTVVRPEGYPDYGVPWEVSTRLIGEAVGKPQQAATLVDEVKQRLADARAEHPELQGKTGVVVLPNPEGGWWPYTPVDARGQFLADLGVELPSALADLDDGSSFYVDVSEEQTDLLEADLVVVIEQPGQRRLTEGSELFQNLDAAKQGRVVYVTSKPLGYAMSYGTVLSIPWTIEALAPELAAKTS